ncbi:MAG: MEMAR_RS02690 family S-layer glycoprotein [Methanoregulaceae archaeon]
MTKRFSLALIALVALAMLILPASAALNQIAQGGDVFIGEEGLDVTAAVGGFPQIAWFASGTVPATDTPNYIIAVGTPASFYVAPADFVGRTGNWYRWNGANQGVAFNVVDPNMDIKVWAQSATGGRDVTGKQVVAGEILNFRVETNAYSVTNRPGALATDGFVTIKVKTADGSTYTALRGLFAGGATTKSLTGQVVTSSLWYWVPTAPAAEGWDTVFTESGSRLYKAGTYTISAELILNRIKDNYKAPDGTDYTGKTVSALKTVAITGDTVKIEASKDTVVRGNQFSVTVTGRPNEQYYVWVKGTSGMTDPAKLPPMIAMNQDGVAQDPVAGPYTIGAYQYEGGAGRTIKDDVAPAPDNGVVYYARITTSSSGTRTVGFTTGPDTDDKKYTIRVENNFAGQFRSDEVNVNVEKGTVTIVAAGDQSYFLGQEVKLSGTNSETEEVYMFITGPNLPSNGGLLTDPRTAVNPFIIPPLFTTTTVNDDNTWEYKWQTANLNIDAGTYTIYAVSTPNARDQLAGTQYGTVSIIIRKPFVTAQVSQSTVAQGDDMFIRGIAEGQPSQGVAIWIMGKNYATRATESVNDDGTFDYEVSGALTSQMTSGQYFVVVQHPMYNDLFDVEIQGNFVVGAYPVRWSNLFALFGAGSLQGSDAANALTIAMDNAAIDDTYTKLQFLVEVPEIRITPVTQKMVGDKFEVGGTTNLAVDDELLVEIYSSSFGPTPKEATGEFSGASGTVKVVRGTEGFNTWSFPVDATLFKADEYIVQVTAIGLQTAQDVTATTLFTVVDAVPTTVPTTAPPTTEPTTAPPTTVPTTVPPTTPGFGALVALIGLGAVAFLIVRKH